MKTCGTCGEVKDLSDFYLSWSRGGTDHWWNLVRSCATCNRSKRDKTAEEFIDWRKRYPVTMIKS